MRLEIEWMNNIFTKLHLYILQQKISLFNFKNIFYIIKNLKRNIKENIIKKIYKLRYFVNNVYGKMVKGKHTSVLLTNAIAFG